MDNPIRTAAYVLAGAFCAQVVVRVTMMEPLLLIAAIVCLLAVFCPNSHDTDTLEYALD